MDLWEDFLMKGVFLLINDIFGWENLIYRSSKVSKKKTDREVGVTKKAPVTGGFLIIFSAILLNDQFFIQHFFGRLNTYHINTLG